MKLKKTTVGILALSMITLSGIFVTPIISLVAQAFPDSSTSAVQMIVSASTLTALIGAWITGKLSTVLSRKTIALIGAAGILVFGTLPFFLHSSLGIVIALSALMGVCLGFINNVLPTLITLNYDVDHRQTMMGMQTAFASVGAMIFVYLAGQLGTVEWYYAYLVYLFAAVVLIVVWVTLPSKQTFQIEENADSEQHLSLREALNPKVIFLVVAGFFFLIANNAYSNNISLVVTESGLGDSNTAGLISTVGQLGGLIAGLLIGQMAKFVGKYLLMIGFLVEGVALLILGLSNNVALLFVGAFLAGIGLSIYYAQTPFLITMQERPQLITLGIAAMTTMNALGGFVSPVLVNAINSVVFDSAAYGTMIIGAVIALVFGVILGVTRFQERCLTDRPAEDAVEQ